LRSNVNPNVVQAALVAVVVVGGAVLVEAGAVGDGEPGVDEAAVDVVPGAAAVVAVTSVVEDDELQAAKTTASASTADRIAPSYPIGSTRCARLPVVQALTRIYI
jgi:hypothetical protein